MFLARLKRYTPRGIYGRAALILLVPIFSLMVVVTLVFIQRHFEDVTRQMTRSLVLDLSLVLDRMAGQHSAETAREVAADVAGPLQVRVDFPSLSPPSGDQRRFYDLSGRYVAETLRETIADVIAVDLAGDWRRVRIWVETAAGPARLTVLRSRVSASNPHQFLVLMGFVGLVMTLIAFLFLRNQLRPIRRLARAAEAFGHGRIEPYKPTGAAEVRSAGNAFLDMRARIERQIEQRTMMLSGVSHDLRTPLTRLKLSLSMQDPSAERSAMERDLHDMERLLDEFLAFARADALDDLVPTDPLALVRDMIARMSTQRDRVSAGEMIGTGEVTLRPMAIERSLQNLIGNALRYGNQARVSVEMSEKALRFAVEDDGPGIAPQDREQAMKPFARLDKARNQDQGTGVGLGLAIAADIARRHGGMLRLGESAVLGGLKAEIVLPR